MEINTNIEQFNFSDKYGFVRPFVILLDIENNYL